MKTAGKYNTAELIGVLQRTLDNYHAGLYPNLKYIDEDAIVAIIEKLKEARRYATLLKAAERVDKHLTLDRRRREKNARKKVPEIRGPHNEVGKTPQGRRTDA